jgi:beta-mannosidase
MTLYYSLHLESDFAQDYTICIEGKCGESRFVCARRLWHNSGKLNFTIETRQLWWPKNAGEQNLYDTTVTLSRDGEMLDACALRIGVRTVTLDRTSMTDMNGSGEFLFRVNGKKIFITGTNWVALDAFHANDLARLPGALALRTTSAATWCVAGAAACMSTTGSLIFATKRAFCLAGFLHGLRRLSLGGRFWRGYGKRGRRRGQALRNHPSLALWAGDNECDVACAEWNDIRSDPNGNPITREVIPRLLRLNDHTRPYLPSSPYIDEEAYRQGCGRLPENHLWGPRDYNKSPFYSQSTAHFASEIGYHGCPAPETLRKFLSEDALWPWQDNDEWIVHASSPELDRSAPYVYRIELMAKQIRELFGGVSDNLEDFALATRFSQAEALKYFIELFRTAKWRRTGILCGI